ncbi:MAG TPA: type 2 lanthipeptide synthetase LanM [Bacillales bacterium]
MEYSKKDLLHIAARSSSMDERLQHEVNQVPLKKASTEKEIQKKLDKWCRLAAKGDQGVFSKRLRWAGLDEELAKQAVGPVAFREDSVLPNWSPTFEKVLKAISVHMIEPDILPTYRFLRVDHPVPFEHLLIPMILTARQRLKDRAGSLYAWLAESAKSQMERTLLQHLSELSSGVLGLEFSLECAASQAGGIAFSAQSILPQDTSPFHEHQPDRLYQGFIRKMYDGQFLSLFKEYSVLAKLIATRIDFWVNTHAELLQRFQHDRKEIGSVFFDDQRPHLISSLKGSLSDFHSCGQSVSILTFEDGNKLVYKPKSLGLDAAFFSLLTWLKKQDAPMEFKQMAILDRGDYGWVEYISHHPCDQKEDVARFYERAGGLLCLIHFLEGTDFHYENVISHGSYPVFIDLETIIYPRMKWRFQRSKVDNTQDRAFKEKEYSVLGTGFLPTWIRNAQGDFVDVSGLLAGGDEHAVKGGFKYIFVNTDRMAVTYDQVPLKLKGHLPAWHGKTVNVDEYQDTFADGFQRMYEFIMQHQEALLADDSPLSAFQDQQVRFVFRATKVYDTVLQKSFHPDCLRDGVDRSLKLEVLARVFLNEADQPPTWPIFSEERRAMEQMDVPILRTRTENEDLEVTENKGTEPVFRKSGFDAVLSKLKAADEVSMQQQLQYIRNSLKKRKLQMTKEKMKASNG